MRQRSLYTSTRSNRPGSCTNIPSDSNISSHRERSYSIFSIQNDDEIRDISANLQAPSQTAGRDA